MITQKNQARIVKNMGSDNKTLTQGNRELVYDCNSTDQCNSQKNAWKKILGAVTIEDRLQAEIAPLMKIIHPFDPRAADCPPPDLQRCGRCIVSSIQMTTHTEYECATCEPGESQDNYVEHSKTFVLSNRTLDFDDASNIFIFSTHIIGKHLTFGNIIGRTYLMKGSS